MHMQSLAEFSAIASPAQRAYVAQSRVVFDMLEAETLVGWETLDGAREFHVAFASALAWDGWKPPTLCGPNGHEVSRFVPQLNELRMAPQDLNIVAYTHELAHSMAPTDQHGERWARLHVDLLAAASAHVAIVVNPEGGMHARHSVSRSSVYLRDLYQRLGVLS